MTTRNFRVNNGLEVGDIVISANANTITGGSTAAPNADGQFANKKFVDDKASLTVLNTSVAVADTGSNGTITNTADGGAVLAQTASTTTITASGRDVPCGNRGSSIFIDFYHLFIELNQFLIKF